MLNLYENYFTGSDKKTVKFSELREQLNKLETDEEYIKFVRDLDKLFNEQDCNNEKRFCKIIIHQIIGIVNHFL